MPSTPIPARRCAGRAELRDGQRHQQQRAREDRRDHAGGVQLQRQVRTVAAEHAVADLALGILDDQPALRALHENDERDHRHRHRHQAENEGVDIWPVRPSSKHLSERERQVGHDAGEDDERNAVADAALR